MPHITQRLIFPRPEPQNTGWLRAAGLPSTPVFTGAFAQQRGALLVGKGLDRPIQLEIENQITPVNLPAATLIASAAVPQPRHPILGGIAAPPLTALLVAAALGRDLAFEALVNPAPAFAGIPASGSPLFLPAYVQQRGAVLVDAARDIAATFYLGVPQTLISWAV